VPTGITIIGLGPSGSEHWTQAAHKLLREAKEVYLRTTYHSSVSDIPGQIHTFDNWYQQNRTLDQIHDQVAAEIVRLGQHSEGVIYAVPGHPNVGEATVPRIRTLANAAKLAVTIIPGLSYLDATFTALNLDTPGNLQIADAGEIAVLHHPALEPGRPALITHLSGQEMTVQIKRTLLNAYSNDFNVTLLQAIGTKDERIWSCSLSILDSQPNLDLPSTLYLPPDNAHSNFSAFQETIAHLRSPGGCPWDREQTHQSLRSFLLEETYEVLEALDADDPAALAEELGDLLLQIVLHTQIAIDTGQFKMGTVIDHINRKLLRRHPHVFGNMVINRVADVTANWEAIKKREKVAKGQPVQTVSALDGVPEALPALAQAMAISKEAVRVGFEWPNIEGVLDKVIEEAQEIAEATDPHHLESEIGDLLFSVVNLARWQYVDPESALRSTNARFSHRFKKMEALAAAQNKNLSDISIDEMDTLWDEAKKQLQP
jgi:tetrapyrrole methylase family protein/MazG family protein